MNMGIMTAYFILIALISWGQTTQLDQIRKDFSIACEISKEARKLSKTKKYSRDPNALNLWIQGEVKNRIQTEDILKLSSTTGMVDERTRENVWKQTADDLGVSGFTCPNIGEFL